MSSRTSHSTLGSRRGRRSQASLGTKSTNTGSHRPSRLTSTRSLVLSPSGTSYITIGDPLRQWIILKVAFVVITMTVGAVLALGINLMLLDKMIYAAPSGDAPHLDDPENLECVDEPVKFCLFQHRPTKKCLAIKGPGKQKEKMLMVPCAKDLSEARYQTFHYDPRDHHLYIRKVRQAPNTDLVSVCATAAPIPMVTKCINRPVKDQIFYYTKDFRFYNVQKDGKKRCITASKAQRPTMTLCLKKHFKSQQFKCLPLKKSKILKSDHALHENYTPPLSKEESEVTTPRRNANTTKKPTTDYPSSPTEKNEDKKPKEDMQKETPLEEETTDKMIREQPIEAKEKVMPEEKEIDGGNEKAEPTDEKIIGKKPIENKEKEIPEENELKDKPDEEEEKEKLNEGKKEPDEPEKVDSKMNLLDEEGITVIPKVVDEFRVQEHKKKPKSLSERRWKSKNLYNMMRTLKPLFDYERTLKPFYDDETTRKPLLDDKRTRKSLLDDKRTRKPLLDDKRTRKPMLDDKRTLKPLFDEE